MIANIINYFRRNGFWVLLILTFFVGVALRFHNLNRFDFWYDEIISIWMSKKIFILIDYPIDVATPPLFNILLNMWMHFGEGEFTLRLLPLIFGILSIFGIYKIGELLFNRTIGLISAFMISISAFHVYYSQELRAYSLVTFLSIASMFFLIKALKGNKLNLWTAYVVFTTLCIYSHNHTVFLIIAQNVFFIIFFKKYRYLFQKWLTAQAIVLFLYIPWIKISLKQLPYIATSWHYSWMAHGNLKNFFDTLLIFLTGYAPIPLGICSFLLIAPLFTSGLLFFKQGKEQISLLGLWLFLPILITLLISRFLFPIYLHRALIYVSPAFYIITAFGIYKFKRNVGFVLLIIFIGLSIAALRNHYKNIISSNISYRIGIISRKEYKASSAYVENNFKEGDIIVHTSNSTIPSFWFYTGQKEIDRNLGFIDNITTLQNYIKGYKRVWLVYSEWNIETLYKNPNRIENKIKKWLDHNLILLDSKKFTGIEIYLYEVKISHR